MFSLTPPSATVAAARIAAARQLERCAPRFLSVAPRTLISPSLPSYALDYSQSRIGNGGGAFAAARCAFERWEMFDLGWVRVANPTVRIESGEVVAVEAHTLGLWSLNLSRILEVVDTPVRFGFLYATTQFHVEDGEELFLLELDPASGEVTYTLEAVSRPQSPVAFLGFPITRIFQHKFAQDSHRRMKESISQRGT